MIVTQIKASTRLRRTMFGSVIAMLGVIQLGGSLARADATKPRIIPVKIDKGETYTITGVQPGAVPNVKIVNNTHAIVLQSAPGRIELVGADSGRWLIKVPLATGEKVTYAVTVKADAPPQGDLVPGAAPTAIR